MIKVQRLIFCLSVLFFGGANLVQAANPDYASLSATSNNPDAAWAKQGDVITFNLTLNVAENSDGTGLVNFSVGGTGGQTASFPLNGVAGTSHLATYTVPSGVDGAISVTGVSFQNLGMESLINVPILPLNPNAGLSIDTTAPVLSSISAVSDNADTTKAKNGDSVQLAINLVTADTWRAGNNLGYTIGAGALTSPSNYVSTSGTAVKLSGLRTVNILGTDAGVFSINSLNFFDKAGNAITGFLAGSPTPNVTVDNTPPAIVFTDNVAAGPLQNDDIVITATDADLNNGSLEYGFSADAVCDGSDVFGNLFASGVFFTINTEVNNSQYICAKAMDNTGNTTFAISANLLNVDTTPPVLVFTDDVAVGPGVSDNIALTATDADLNSGALEYGFSADAVCDATDVFGNTFTSGGVFTINTEANNGQYICAKAEDNSGNVGFIVSANSLNIDITDPVILFTNDVLSGPVPSDDIVITATDADINAGSLEYGFSADAICDVTDTFGNGFASGVLFTINTEGNNGSYLCAKAADNTGNTIYAISANPLNIDSTPPVMLITDGVETGPLQSDSIMITATDADLNNGSLEYGFSADAVCNAADTFGNAFASGVAFAINTETNNGKYLCAKSADNAGNTVYAVSANVLNIDVTPPSITSVTQTSSNANTAFAKAGDTVTYAVTYSEAVTVGAINAASAGVNATGAATEVSAAGSTTDTLVVTVQAGDNGVISPVVNFDIADAAGNTVTITSLGAITGGGAGNTVTADTNVPTLNPVGIGSDNALSASWAKTGDTLALSFTSNETINGVSGTILAETGSVLNTGGNSWTMSLTTSGNETEGVAAFVINFSDLAGNSGVAVTGTTDGSSVTFDKTAPTIPTVSISSSNVLNSSLAKSNDTITVTFSIADNLATTASVRGTPTILTKTATSNVTGLGAGQTITRFTDGTETSEVAAPFRFVIQDEAGNRRTTTATTDGSVVQFDRTDPVVSNVEISATSADNSAYLADAPTYYAKQGDTLDFSFEVCDYVDSQSNPPTGDVFSSLGLTLTDAGLTGSTCTTPEGNTVGLRKWSTQLVGIDGTEGTVAFDIDVYDNAGNSLVNVTSTTNGSQVIFDKTLPQLPTDAVDLAGVSIPRFKPTTDAVYAWGNDIDVPGGAPVSGVQNYEIRYLNTNTGIDENVTRSARSFVPTQVIPDNSPYDLFMQLRDKAGNITPSTVIYSQAYGPTIAGTVTDKETGEPISGVQVNAVAAFGEECDTGITICGDVTDSLGKYGILVQPNQTYTLDAVRAPDYYIAKEQVVVGTLNVTAFIALKHVDNGDVQTGNQGTVITLDLAFEDEFGNPQTTYVTAFSKSGEVTVNKTANGIEITSFGAIASVKSNNPSLVITNQGNNTYLVKTPVKILNVADNTNSASSVSSTFESGANRVGTRAPLGGASAGFQAGMKREERVVNGGWTPQESRDFAKKLNQGSDYKVNQYVNSNGYTVFSGYQKGRMAVEDMKGSDPNVRMQKKIIYRGVRAGSSAQNKADSVQDRKEVIKDMFYTEADENAQPAVSVVKDNVPKKANRAQAATKKTAMSYDNPELAGYGRKVEMYPSVYNKKANDARYVNKFARVAPEADVAPSRIQAKNTNMIVFRGKSRNGKKLTLGQMFQQNPQLVTQRQRVVKR